MLEWPPQGRLPCMVVAGCMPAKPRQAAVGVQEGCCCLACTLCSACITLCDRLLQFLTHPGLYPQPHSAPTACTHHNTQLSLTKHCQLLSATCLEQTRKFRAACQGAPLQTHSNYGSLHQHPSAQFLLCHTGAHCMASLVKAACTVENQLGGCLSGCGFLVGP